MNKKVLIVAGILLLLAFGGVAGFKLMGNKKVDSTSQDIQNGNPTAPNAVQSLKDIFSTGQSQTCTYSADTGSGVVYVNSGMMRGDFETKAETVQTGHVLVKDNTSYVWAEGQANGIKMTFKPEDLDSVIAKGTETQTNPENLEDINYSCTSWKADSSKFELPKDVQFSEITLPKMDSNPGAAPAGGAAGDNTSACSYCNALSGDDKTQCLKALNCQ